MMNRRCRKCGNLYVYPVYDKSDDTLEFECDDCGYTWKDKPLDRRYEDELSEVGE